ncbi:MAG: hypothetical protein V4692_02720 [Bdellovibrionota bacterium]
MKTMFKTTCTLAIIVTELVASTGMCSVSEASRSPQSFVFTREPDFSRGMDASVIQPMSSMNDLDMTKIMPSDMDPRWNMTQASGRILDHSLSNFFNSDSVRNSSLGRSAHQIDQSMSGGVSMGGIEPDTITHEVKFQMRASQARAQLEYSGLTNAQLSYQAVDSKLDLEVREEVALIGTQVVYNHIAQNGDNTDMLSMRWAW